VNIALEERNVILERTCGSELGQLLCRYQLLPCRQERRPGLLLREVFIRQVTDLMRDLIVLASIRHFETDQEELTSDVLTG
jgi:hypothetical protein